MNARALSLSFLLCWGTILSSCQTDEVPNPVLDKVTHERYSDVKEDGVLFASEERTVEDDNEVVGANEVNRQTAKLLEDDNWEGLYDILENEEDLHQRVRREDSPIKLPSIIENGFKLGKKIVDGAVGTIRTIIDKIKEKKGSLGKDIIKKPFEGLQHVVEKIPKPEGGPIATIGKLFKNGKDHMEDSVKNLPFGIGDKLKGKRDRRSIWDDLGNTHGMQKVMKSGKATVAEALNGGAAIRKILAQAQAETNSAKAELYKKKFKSDVFENDLEDWMLLGTPMGSDVFNKAFQEPKHQTNDPLRPTSLDGKSHDGGSIMSTGMGDTDAKSPRNDAAGIDIHELSDEKTVNIDRPHFNELHGDYIGGHFNRHTRPHNRWTYENRKPHVNIYRNNFDHKSRFGSPVIHSSTNALGNNEHRQNEGMHGAISNSNAHNPFASQHNINNNVVIGHGNTNEVGLINAHGSENKMVVGNKLDTLRNYDSTQPSSWDDKHNAAWRQDFKLFNDASTDNVVAESHRRPIIANQKNHGIPVEKSANSQSAASASAHAAANVNTDTERHAHVLKNRARQLRRRFNPKYQHLFSNGQSGVGIYDDSSEEDFSSDVGAGLLSMLFDDVTDRPRKHYKFFGRRPPDNTEKDIEFQWAPNDNSRSQLLSYTKVRPVVAADNHLPKRLIASNERPENIYDTDKYRTKPHAHHLNRNSVIPGVSPNIGNANRDMPLLGDISRDTDKTNVRNGISPTDNIPLHISPQSSSPDMMNWSPRSMAFTGTDTRPIGDGNYQELGRPLSKVANPINTIGTPRGMINNIKDKAVEFDLNRVHDAEEVSAEAKAVTNVKLSSNNDEEINLGNEKQPGKYQIGPREGQGITAQPNDKFLSKSPAKDQEQKAASSADVTIELDEHLQNVNDDKSIGREHRNHLDREKGNSEEPYIPNRHYDSPKNRNNNYFDLNGPENKLPFTGMPGMEYANREKPIYERKVMPADAVATTKAEASAIGLSKVSDELGANLKTENRDKIDEEHMNRDLSIGSDVEDTALRTFSPETRIPHDNHERIDYASRSKSTETSDTSTLARAVVSEESREYEKPSIDAKSSASATAASEASADTARFDDKESKDSINEVTGKASASSETITSDTVGQRKAEIGTISLGTLEERSKEDVFRNTGESWLPYGRKPIQITLEKSSLPESSKGNEGLSHMFPAESPKSIESTHALQSNEELAEVEERKQKEYSAPKKIEEESAAIAVAHAEADTNVFVPDYGTKNEKIAGPNKVRPLINAKDRGNARMGPIPRRPLMRERPTIPHLWRNTENMYTKSMSNELEENMNFSDLMSFDSDQQDLSTGWDEEFALTSVRDMFKQAMDKRIDVSSKKSRKPNLDHFNPENELNEAAIVKITPEFSNTKSKSRNMFDSPRDYPKSLLSRYGKQWMPKMNLDNLAPGTYQKPTSYENEAIATATGDASASIDAHPEMEVLRTRPLKKMWPSISDHDDDKIRVSASTSAAAENVIHVDNNVKDTAKQPKLNDEVAFSRADARSEAEAVMQQDKDVPPQNLYKPHILPNENIRHHGPNKNHPTVMTVAEASAKATLDGHNHDLSDLKSPLEGHKKWYPKSHTFKPIAGIGNLNSNERLDQSRENEDLSLLNSHLFYSEESHENWRYQRHSIEAALDEAATMTSAEGEVHAVAETDLSNHSGEKLGLENDREDSTGHRPGNKPVGIHKGEDMSRLKLQLSQSEESEENTGHGTKSAEISEVQATAVASALSDTSVVLISQPLNDVREKDRHNVLHSPTKRPNNILDLSHEIQDRMGHPYHHGLPHKPQDYSPLKTLPHPNDNSIETASATAEAEAVAVAEAEVPNRMSHPNHRGLPHKPYNPHKPEDHSPLKRRPHPNDNSLETASATAEAEAVAVAEAEAPDTMGHPYHHGLPHKPHKPDHHSPLNIHPHPNDNSMETVSATAEAEAVAVAETGVPNRMSHPNHHGSPHKPYYPNKPEDHSPLKMYPHPNNNLMETTSASAEAEVPDRMGHPYHHGLPHKPYNPHKPDHHSPLNKHPHPDDNSMETASATAEAEAVAVAEAELPNRLSHPNHRGLPHKPYNPHKPEDHSPLKRRPHPNDNSMETASATAEAEAVAVAEAEVPDRMGHPYHRGLPHKPYNPHKPDHHSPLNEHPHPINNFMETASASAEAEAVAEAGVPDTMGHRYHHGLPHKPYNPHKPEDHSPLNMHLQPNDNSMETVSATAEAEAVAVAEAGVPDTMGHPYHHGLPHKPHKPDHHSPLNKHPHPNDNSMETVSATAEDEAVAVAEAEVPNRMSHPNHHGLPHKPYNPHKPEDHSPLKRRPHPNDNSMETASATAEAEAVAVAEAEVPDRMGHPYHRGLPHEPYNPHKPDHHSPLNEHPHPINNFMETASASAEAEAVAEAGVPDAMGHRYHHGLPHKPYNPHKPEDHSPLNMHLQPNDNSMETVSATAEAEAVAVAEAGVSDTMGHPYHHGLPHKPHKPDHHSPLNKHPHPNDNSMETVSATAEAEAVAVAEAEVPNRMSHPNHHGLPHKPYNPHKPEDHSPLKRRPHPNDNSMETASATAEAEAVVVAEAEVPDRMGHPYHRGLPHKPYNPHKPDHHSPLNEHPHPNNNFMETASASAEAEAVAEAGVPDTMGHRYHHGLPHKPYNPHKPEDHSPLKRRPHPNDNSLETVSATAEAEAMAVAEAGVPDTMGHPYHHGLPHKPHKPDHHSPLNKHPHPNDNSMETASATAEAEVVAVAEAEVPNRMSHPNHHGLPHKPYNPHKPEDHSPLKMYPHPNNNLMETTSASAEAEAVAEAEVPDRMGHPYHHGLPHKPYNPHKPDHHSPLNKHPHLNDNSMETASASAEAEAVAEAGVPDTMGHRYHHGLPHKPYNPHKPEDHSPLKRRPHPNDNSLETASATAEAEAMAVAEAEAPDTMGHPYHHGLPHKPYKPHKPDHHSPLNMHPQPNDNSMETVSATAEAEAVAVAEAEVPDTMGHPYHHGLPHKPHKPDHLSPLNKHPHPNDNSMETASATAEAEAVAVAEAEVPDRMIRPDHHGLPRKPYNPYKPDHHSPLNIHPHPNDNSMETVSATAEAEAVAVAEAEVPDKMGHPYHHGLPHKPDHHSPLNIHPHPNDNSMETVSATAEAEAVAVAEAEVPNRMRHPNHHGSPHKPYYPNKPEDHSPLKRRPHPNDNSMETASATAEAEAVAVAEAEVPDRMGHPYHRGLPHKPYNPQKPDHHSPLNEHPHPNNNFMETASASAEAEAVAEAEAPDTMGHPYHHGLPHKPYKPHKPDHHSPLNMHPQPNDNSMETVSATAEAEAVAVAEAEVPDTMGHPYHHGLPHKPHKPDHLSPLNKHPHPNDNSMETASATAEAEAVAVAEAEVPDRMIRPDHHGLPRKPYNPYKPDHHSPLNIHPHPNDNSMETVSATAEAEAVAVAEAEVPDKMGHPYHHGLPHKPHKPDHHSPLNKHPHPNDNSMETVSATAEAEAVAAAEAEVNTIDNSQSKEQGLWDHIPRRPHKLHRPNHPNTAPLHEILHENEVTEATATAKASVSVETDRHDYKPKHGLPIMPHTHGFNHPYGKDLTLENGMGAQSSESVLCDDDLYHLSTELPTDYSRFDVSTISSGESARDFSLFNMKDDWTMSGFSRESAFADTFTSGLSSSMEKFHRPKQHKINVGIRPRGPANSKEKIETVGESLNAVIEDAAFEEKSVEEEYKQENTKLSDKSGLKGSTVAVAQSLDLPIPHLRNGLEDTAEAEVSIASSHIADEAPRDRVRSNELANGNSVFTGKPHTPLSPTAIGADEDDIFGSIKHSTEKPAPDVLVASVSSEALATIQSHSEIPESKIAKPKGSPIELDENGKLHLNTEDRLGLLTAADIETTPHLDQATDVEASAVATANAVSGEPRTELRMPEEVIHNEYGKYLLPHPGVPHGNDHAPRLPNTERPIYNSEALADASAEAIVKPAISEHIGKDRNVPRKPYEWPEYERPLGGRSNPKEIGRMTPSKELPTPKATVADAITDAAGLGEFSAPIENANVGRPLAPSHDDNRSWNIKNSASSENQSHDDESWTMEIETTEDTDTENVAIPSVAIPLAQAQAIASGKVRSSEQVSEEHDDHGIGRKPVPTPTITSRWGPEEKPYYPESVSRENEVDDISKERVPGAISNRIQPDGSPDTIHMPSSPTEDNPHSVNDLPQVEDQAPFPPFLRAPNHYPMKDRLYPGRPNTPESKMMPPKKDWPFDSTMPKPCTNCETADASSEAQATSHVDNPPNKKDASTEVDTFASASANTAVQPNPGGPPKNLPDNSMKTDIYIVKRTKTGPVTVTHMWDSLPPIVEYRLIPRKIYEQVRNIISKQQAIHAGYSQTTSPLRLN